MMTSLNSWQMTIITINYKISACPYSVLQEFAVEIEVIVTDHSEVVRELRV